VKAEEEAQAAAEAEAARVTAEKEARAAADAVAARLKAKEEARAAADAEVARLTAEEEARAAAEVEAARVKAEEEAQAAAEVEAARLKAEEEAQAAVADSAAATTAKVEAAAKVAKEAALAKASKEVAAAKAAASKAAAPISHRLPSSPRAARLPYMYLQGVFQALEQAKDAALPETGTSSHREKTSWELEVDEPPPFSDRDARKAACSPRAALLRGQSYELPHAYTSPRAYESPRTYESRRSYESPRTSETLPAVRLRRPKHELPSAVRLRRSSSEKLLPSAHLSSPGQLTVRKLRFDQPIGHTVSGPHTSDRPSSSPALPSKQGRAAPSRYYLEKTSWELADELPPSDRAAQVGSL